MVTVGLGSAGHVWLVSGRRLLIWPFRKSGQCRELTLPPTDLAHRAELVTVFLPEGSQVNHFTSITEIITTVILGNFGSFQINFNRSYKRKRECALFELRCY